MTRKYTFKTMSDDNRPVKHCLTWAVVGAGLEGKKRFWMIILWLEEGAGDVLDYYPEAYDIRLVSEKKMPEVKRGGEIDVVFAFRNIGFSDGIFFAFDQINPTFLAVIEEQSRRGIPVTEMAKRMGVNLAKFKRLCRDPRVAMAIDKGYNKRLEDVIKNS